ncbi:hypothetical protein [Corallococcus carmarthensis]|uniref:Uncharacterized protein n=1 Tax=Corallococcus carmarthensis TaxID=2316728 RepID=A0A3A8JT02_9BACT|nr:hypothetical protein [Corallococcus carmarthensis]RKG98116.1 hypothetical protein D7X32_30475 [Corallococcus carmarthensis]
MKRAARVSAPAAPSSIPDTFTLHFHRTPDGWRVDGAAKGTGHYAYEAFCAAFCALGEQPVADAGKAPTAAPVAGPKGGVR